MDDAAIETDRRDEGPVHNHPLDPLSLAFGAIFTILGGVFLFGDVDAATLSVAWVWASLFGAVGVLLMAVGIRRHRRND